MSRYKDLTGKRFGRLVVHSFAGTDKHNRAMWNCSCECGKHSIIAGANLIRGYTKSCGCLYAELNRGITRDFGKTSPLYHIWAGMKDRCFNPQNKSYPYYGGRDVSICSEWCTFEPFYNWALANGYQKGLTIDRIDPSGNYCPDNCRWATRRAQSINRKFKKSKCRGVSWHEASKKWYARVISHGEVVYHELFENFDEACLEVRRARIKYHQVQQEESHAK